LKTALVGVTKVYNVKPKTAKFYRVKTEKICLVFGGIAAQIMAIVITIATALDKKSRHLWKE